MARAAMRVAARVRLCVWLRARGYVCGCARAAMRVVSRWTTFESSVAAFVAAFECGGAMF